MTGVRFGHGAAESNAMGFRIFRAHNTDVFDNIDGVCDSLLAFLEASP